MHAMTSTVAASAVTCPTCGEPTDDIAGICFECGGRLPDLDRARDFLHRLEPTTARVTFQLFDDSKATLATQLDIQAASIRTAVWRRGHFWGLRPIKAPGGRLLWPASSVETLTAEATK
jgi:hypothetical protein